METLAGERRPIVRHALERARQGGSASWAVTGAEGHSRPADAKCAPSRVM
jgi:hypothetical protein